MPKNEKKPEVEQQKSLLEEIFPGENNPEIKIVPEIFQNILQYFSPTGEFETIALEVHKDSLKVFTHNATNNISAICSMLSEDIEIINTGYFIFDVKDTLDKVSRKHKETDILHVTWPVGGKIKITDENGKHPINITPKTLNSVNQSKADRGMIFKDKQLQFNKKDGAQTVKVDGKPVKVGPKTSFTIEQDDILSGLIDAKNADSNNVIFHFSEKENYCVAGLWNKKGDDSRTDDLEVSEFRGETFEDAIPLSGLELAKLLPGEIDVQGNTTTYDDTGKQIISGTIALSQWTELGEIHYGIRVDKKADE